MVLGHSFNPNLHQCPDCGRSRQEMYLDGHADGCRALAREENRQAAMKFLALGGSPQTGALASAEPAVVAL